MGEQEGLMNVVETALFWKDGERFSSRQNARVPLGGIMGSAVLDWNPRADIWALMWLGQWLHVGKGAVMGLGSYRLGPIT